MALLFCDGFDFYATANVIQKWQLSQNGGGSASYAIGGPGRLGYGQFIAMNPASNSVGISYPFPTGPYTTLIVGFACYINSTSTNQVIYAFYDATGNTLTSISVTASNQIGIGGANFSAPGAIFLQTWMYVEAQITFSNTSTGSVTIRVNGQTVFTAGSIVTASNANPCASAGPFSNGASVDYDDVYMLNTTAPNNTFLGDVKIYPLYPAGNGRVSGFSRFGGTSSGNYTAVQEHPPDGDASYVYTATPGTEDAYTLTTLSNIATVLAVQLNGYARKDDTPSRVLSLGVGNGSTENFNAGSSLNTTYSYVLRQLDSNPLTSASWAVGDFTTLQSAIKLIS